MLYQKYQKRQKYQKWRAHHETVGSHFNDLLLLPYSVGASSVSGDCLRTYISSSLSG